MRRTENVELTVLCLVRKDNEYLLQDRIKKDWKGFTLPGGHVEPGEVISSEEGTMHWVKKEDLPKVNLVNDFTELLEVMLDENLSEFQYVVENDRWKVVQR